MNNFDVLLNFVL